MKTKEKIVLKAIELLNEQGLSNVTTRDVSGSLNISIGNLTYHFPKWEDLMDAIFKKFSNELKAIKYIDTPDLIKIVIDYLDQIYEIQMRYSFIFSNFHIFFKLHPQYEELKEGFFLSNMRMMRQDFNLLIEQGVLQPEDEDHDYSLLVKNLWMVFYGWYSFTSTFKQTTAEMSKYDFFTTIWNLFAFHLTEEGRASVVKYYDEMIEKKLN